MLCADKPKLSEFFQIQMIGARSRTMEGVISPARAGSILSASRYRNFPFSRRNQRCSLGSDETILRDDSPSDGIR